MRSRRRKTLSRAESGWVLIRFKAALFKGRWGLGQSPSGGAGALPLWDWAEPNNGICC